MVAITPAEEEALTAAPSLLQGRFREELARVEHRERTMILAMWRRRAALMDAGFLGASPGLVPGPRDATTQRAAPPMLPVELPDASGDAVAVADQTPTVPRLTHKECCT